MNHYGIAHEGFMSASRTILPRVGGGVGVGEGAWAEGPMHRYGSRANRAASNADATSTPTATMHALREIGGGL